MFSKNDIKQLSQATAYDADGDKIGSVTEVYLDERSNAPEWITVKTGLFGTKETFVPLDKAKLTNDRIDVPFDKDQVKNAPQIDADGRLSPAEEDHLYTYYGIAATDGTPDIDTTTGGTTPRTDRSDEYNTGTGDSSGRAGGNRTGGDGAMTRSEERLVTDTRREETGKARLRKYVVTEEQQVTVPVTREEVRLDREPITDADGGDAFDGPAISESEHEVTLHAERPVVDTEAVPVERVKLNKETVTEQQRVSGEVRKEQIEFDADERN